MLLLFSCKKETSENTNNPTTTIPSSFTKRVLLEDYSKHCPFCLPLNSKLDSMKNAYPNNTFIPIIVSANHSTQIDYFDTIKNVFNITSTPSGSVNRVPAVNSGSQNGKLVYSKENWGTNVDAELLKATNQGLKIKSELIGNLLDFEVMIGSHETTNNLKLTVFIIENDSYYRTLRKVVTGYKGDNLSLEKDKILSRNFNAIDLSSYSLSNTTIVAFLHHFDEGSQNFEVVNVNEVKVGENVDW